MCPVPSKKRNTKGSGFQPSPYDAAMQHRCAFYWAMYTVFSYAHTHNAKMHKNDPHTGNIV
jgi:hypothetical protein